MPRFRTAGPPRMVVAGAGWRARFEGGAFASDDDTIVNGLRRYAQRFPAHRISEVDEPVPSQPDAPLEGVTSDGEGPGDPQPRSRARRGRGTAPVADFDQPIAERQAVYDEAHAAGILEEPATASEDDGVALARIEGDTLVETVVPADADEDA
jgi:hypothetical protein